MFVSPCMVLHDESSHQLFEEAVFVALGLDVQGGSIELVFTIAITLCQPDATRHAHARTCHPLHDLILWFCVACLILVIYPTLWFCRLVCWNLLVILKLLYILSRERLWTSSLMHYFIITFGNWCHL